MIQLYSFKLNYNTKINLNSKLFNLFIKLFIYKQF